MKNTRDIKCQNSPWRAFSCVQSCTTEYNGGHGKKYPVLCQNLAKLEGEHTIYLKEKA